MPEPPPGAHTAIGKILVVLEALTRHRGGSAIAHAAGVERTTGVRLLRQLAAAGWVVRVRRGEYEPGPTLVLLADRICGADPDNAQQPAGYADADVHALAEVLTKAHASGCPLGAHSFARAVLDAGYRPTTTPTPRKDTPTCQ